MKSALCIEVFVLLLAARLWMVCSSARSTADVSACSCDCCEVEHRREDAEVGVGSQSERFQCALTQDNNYNSPFRTKASTCSNLCKQDPNDQILTATEVREIDTERFCFFECQPAKDTEPQPGDDCRHISRADAQNVRDSSGNAHAPMERPRVMVHFLAHRRNNRRPSPDEGAYSRRASLVAAGSSMGGQARAVPPVSPWASLEEPAQEDATQAVRFVEQADWKAQQAAYDAKTVETLRGTVGGSLTNALAAVERAKEASIIANKAADHIRAIKLAVREEARKEAFKEIPGELKKMKEEAQKKADEEAAKRKAGFTKELKAEGDKAKVEAMKPFEEAQKRAGAAATTYASRGDALVGESAKLQMSAAMEQGSANQYIAVGDMGKAQQMMQMSRQNMNLALSFNAQAGKMYDTAQAITASLPKYAAQAAAASYHAESMYNPNIMPPSAPLIS